MPKKQIPHFQRNIRYTFSPKSEPYAKNTHTSRVVVGYIINMKIPLKEAKYDE